MSPACHFAPSLFPRPQPNKQGQESLLHRTRLSDMLNQAGLPGSNTTLLCWNSTPLSSPTKDDSSLLSLRNILEILLGSSEGPHWTGFAETLASFTLLMLGVFLLKPRSFSSSGVCRHAWVPLPLTVSSTNEKQLFQTQARLFKTYSEIHSLPLANKETLRLLLRHLSFLFASVWKLDMIPIPASISHLIDNDPLWEFASRGFFSYS